MGVLGDALRWLTDPSNYGGPGGIDTRVVEHLLLSYQAVLVAAIAALPLGVYVGHRRHFETWAITVGSLGRALPSFGVLGILFGPTLDLPGKIGYWATFVALVLLALPPVLINAYVGVKGVDPDVVEAARGMGMTGGDVLRRIKIPLAVPLIVNGLRIASMQSVATATLWGVAGGGALGRIIVDGFATRRADLLLGGAILVALLAIITEVAFAAGGRLLAPTTSSQRSGGRGAATAARAA